MFENTDGGVSRPVFALSFFDRRPPNVKSKSVIGWLPVSGDGENVLNDFVQNGALSDTEECVITEVSDTVRRTS